MINLIGCPESQMKETLDSWGEAPYRTTQILSWVYQKGARSFDDMTNLSKSLRAHLAENFVIRLPKILNRTESKDGSIKFLFEVEGGGQVESIWMPEKNRKTLCLSSQVGCRLACSFCLTGTLGLKDQLTAGDIIGQVMAVNEQVAESDRITNLVFMGMGEPLDNYKPVVDALRLLSSPAAVKFPAKRITVSTSGLVEQLRRFGEEGLQVNLAISLNATDNATRDRIMPINRKYPIETLIDCLREYRIKNNRRITFEYVLLKDVNDRMEDARRLAKLLNGLPCKINLIPFNVYGDSPYRPPSQDRIEEFQQFLIGKHYSVFVRKNRGTDILGACGQLAAESFTQDGKLPASSSC